SLYLSVHLHSSVPATTDYSTLSLHDALPISPIAGNICPPEYRSRSFHISEVTGIFFFLTEDSGFSRIVFFVNRKDLSWLNSGLKDRKSTRLNSSHVKISYAVFCLKKKK